MKIKQIELIGFKSFAEKIILPLHDGITCIVGPNGCGKSNIVDAFRWVLGEQSAKSLRGEKMEEVIFQGTDLKKQKGMSEVCLSLTINDNPYINGTNSNPYSSKANNPDFIVIARRLYRSGESEYLINKKQCRLKDIRDLLLDTGLDVKSYSILDQNRISEIVNSKPQDRRFLIEEIAGVMKYKVRKAEAEAKLESSKENLTRINDIIIERKRQLGSLDRLAKKANKYKQLLSELNETEIRLNKYKHSKNDEELQSLLKEGISYETELTAKKAYLSELINKIETNKLEIAHKQRTLADIDAQMTKWTKELSDTEKNSAILKTHIENYKSEVQRLTMQIEQTEENKKANKDKLEEMQTLKRQLQSSIELFDEKINNQLEKLKSMDIHIREKETISDSLRREIFKVSDEISSMRNELNKRYSHLEHINYKEEVASRDKENLIKTIQTLTINIKGFEDSISEQTNELNKLNSDIHELSKKIDEIEKNMELSKKRLAKCREDLAGNYSRLESIKELFNKNPALTSINEALQNKPLPLSDLLIVDKEYETAFESLLHDKINSLTINSLQDVHHILQIISEKNLVRTTLFYDFLWNIETSALPLPNIEGLIGRVNDHIYDNGLNSNMVKLIKYELTNTYMIESVNHAISYIENNKPQQDITFVTQDGIIINSKGWITHGKGTEVLKIKRQVRELELIIQTLETDISKLENEINLSTNERENHKDKLSRLSAIYSEKDKKISLHKQTLQETEKDLQRRKRKLESIDSEFFTLKSEKDELSIEIERLTSNIKAHEEKRDLIQKEITTIQEELSQLRTQYSKEQDVNTSFKLEKTSLTGRLQSCVNEIDSLNKLLKEYDDNINSYTINKEKTLAMIDHNTKKLQELEIKIKECLENINTISASQNIVKNDLTSHVDKMADIEEAITITRTHIEGISNIMNDINQRSFEKKIIKENLEQSVFHKHGIYLTEIPFVECDIEQDEKRFNELNEKIRDLGPVSLDTINEYEELKRDYDFLVKQQQDLILSIEELEEAINRINTTTKKRLREAYNLLRERFNAVFVKLFGGGKADIILTDENNILEAGLEIIAQPPGKKNQNINQLSGGEKALTSLALLFAGFLIKPSPLCILDEADAPLDESNTERFANMIKELSIDTQFIIITHNRITMEIADYLYGITMEEPGISKTISLQFKDIERMIN